MPHAPTDASRSYWWPSHGPTDALPMPCCCPIAALPRHRCGGRLSSSIPTRALPAVVRPLTDLLKISLRPPYDLPTTFLWSPSDLLAISI